MSKLEKMNFKKPSDLIYSQLQEGTKSKFGYDGSQRLSIQYTAAWNAEDGDICLITEYTYVGASNRVDAMKEYLGAWDSSWDF